MTEYDYKAQQWVEGEEARLLRIEHIQQEIHYLETCGEGFLAAIRSTSTVSDAWESARRELSSLQEA